MSPAPPAGWRRDVSGSGQRRGARLLERKLTRRPLSAYSQEFFRGLAIRIYSAVAGFISMVLVAWLGAFARVLSANHWRAFVHLDKDTLLIAAAQAERYEVRLLPVLVVWGVLLVITPTGYTAVFPAAACIAGILGFLHFSPPDFQVTARIATASQWLTRFDSRWSRDAIPFLISSIVVAYLLQASSASIFKSLRYSSSQSRFSSHFEISLRTRIRNLVAVCLVLLVLLSVTWSATVIQLVAARNAELAYGFQGGLEQSRYLLVLTLTALCFARIYNVKRWLFIAVSCTALYSIEPKLLPFPSMLEVSAGRGGLAHLGEAWGSNSVWAALFIVIPAVIFGIYVVARLLRSP